MGASGSSSDPPPKAAQADEQESPVSLRCGRCGGRGSVRQPKKERNPFMPRPPIHVVCTDCGLEFDVDQPEMPPSGAPPW